MNLSNSISFEGRIIKVLLMQILIIAVIVTSFPGIASGSNIRLRKESESVTIVLAEHVARSGRVRWEPAGRIVYTNSTNGELQDNDGNFLCRFEVVGSEYKLYNRDGQYFGSDDRLWRICESFFADRAQGSTPTAPPPEWANESQFGLISVRLRNKNSRAYNDWKIWIDGKRAGFVYEFLPPNFLEVPFGKHIIEVGYGFDEVDIGYDDPELRQIHKRYNVEITSRTGNGTLIIPD